MNNHKVDLQNAFFHGLAGGEVSFVMYPKDGLYLTMTKLEDIIKHRRLYSRDKQKELGIGIANHPEFGTHINFADVNSKNNYVSVCKRTEKLEDSAFEEFIENKVSIALSPDLAEKFNFRGKIHYTPDIGEEQILESIGMDNFIAIVNDIKNEEYSRKATELIAQLLRKYKCYQLPITNMKGEKLVDLLRDIEEER